MQFIQESIRMCGLEIVFAIIVIFGGRYLLRPARDSGV
jgi:hypothetical protein